MEDICVAVVGGSGFLGQHIIRELQFWNKEQSEGTSRHRTESDQDERSNCYVNMNINLELNEAFQAESDESELVDIADSPISNVRLKEIRVLDIKPFDPTLELFDNPPISSYMCDIRMENMVTEMLEGVDVVFLCAAVTDQVAKWADETKPDEELFWETNLEGSENVVSACKRNNVRVLIYTSTITAVLGKKRIISLTESMTPPVDEAQLLLGSYARSRKRAEDVVLNAHRMLTVDETRLLTTVLRPVTLYGEGDVKFIPSLISLAQEAGGKLPQLGGTNSYQQLTYAGNAAYAHVCAMTRLLEGAMHPLRDIGGLPIYICDDSPIGRPDEVLRPFLSNFGLSTSSAIFPLFIVLLFTFFMGLWVTMWKKIGWPSRYDSTLPSTKFQSVFGKTTIVSRVRAELALHFKPKYSWEYSKKVSLAYYEKYIEQKALRKMEI